MRAASARIPWQATFLLLSLLWGSSFLLIKYADRGFSPVQVGLGRALVATIVLGLLLVAQRELPRLSLRDWLQLAIAAVLLNAIPFVLFAWGETRTSSILAGIWFATAPLWTLAFVFAFDRRERPSRTGVVGIVVGFAGVIVVLGPWRHLSAGAVGGDLACIAASAINALGFVHTRRHLSARAHSNTVLASAQLFCATAVLAVAAVAGSHVPRHVPVESWLGVAGLGVSSTAIGYILYHRLVRAAGPTTASTVTYVMPLVATVLGVLALSEHLGWNVPVGGLVVLGAAALGQGRLRLGRRAGAARTGYDAGEARSARVRNAQWEIPNRVRSGRKQR